MESATQPHLGRNRPGIDTRATSTKRYGEPILAGCGSQKGDPRKCSNSLAESVTVKWLSRGRFFPLLQVCAATSPSNPLCISESPMQKLDVRAELIGTKLHRLEIFKDGTFIGEYERSQAKDIDRKIREIQLASDLLVETFTNHGPFVVRWDGENHRKSIRVDGTHVATVPKDCWQKPSWG